MGVWETLRGELAAATGREFERRSLPILRLFHRDLIVAPELRDLDRAGIDMLVWSDDGRFPCVVQCKGFKANEAIGRSQIDQILKSIAKFKNSGFSCVEYVLLHNRTGENREAEGEIERGLLGLRETGKVDIARLWDRQSFIARARAQIRDMIVARMREDAETTLRQQQRLFKFGPAYVPVVPVLERKLVVNIGEPMLTEDIHRVQTGESVAELIISSMDTRWTLLTGHFGIGKTTTALHVAQLRGHNVIYVRAAEMTDRGGGVGTNKLLSSVAEALDIFADFDDETRKVAGLLAGWTMTRLLRGKESEFALVIDGLDENRIYAQADGMRRLTNELAELNCPIILTTRREHFDATFSNFQRTFQDLSRKGGTERSGRLIDFGMWTNKEVEEFLAIAKTICPPGQVGALQRFGEALRSGEADRLYGDLPRHPLFLQMILEEVAEGRIAERTRADLVRDWMERKIRRDVTVDRATPTDIVDVDTFVATMMHFQELTAGLMTMSEENNRLSLTETISSEEIERIAFDVFKEKVDVSTILTCSVLSAATRRRRGAMPVKFLLRVCQEFFLAAHLSRNDVDPSNYPLSVQEFWKELRRERGHRRDPALGIAGRISES